MLRCRSVARPTALVLDDLFNNCLDFWPLHPKSLNMCSSKPIGASVFGCSPISFGRLTVCMRPIITDAMWQTNWPGDVQVVDSVVMDQRWIPQIIVVDSLTLNVHMPPVHQTWLYLAAVDDLEVFQAQFKNLATDRKVFGRKLNVFVGCYADRLLS